MRLETHIANSFLTLPELGTSIIKKTFPDFDGTPENEFYSKAMTLIDVISPNNNTNYYVTKSVSENLELLKFNRDDNGNFDWTVFNDVKQQKSTFIFPENKILRLHIFSETMCFFHLELTKNNFTGKEELYWIVFHVNRKTGELLKIMFQISQLDLTNPDVLEEQLIGVDVAYFDLLITALRNKFESDKNFKISNEYFNALIDKIFNENESDKD